MSLYKDLLFLHGHLHDTRFADPPRSYAEGYGNALATRSAFPSLRGLPARLVRRAIAPASQVPAACGCR